MYVVNYFNCEFFVEVFLFLKIVIIVLLTFYGVPLVLWHCW